MVREEFSYKDIEKYLLSNNDLLIVGSESEDERSSFFFQKWSDKKKPILRLQRVDTDTVEFFYFENGIVQVSRKVDLCVGIPQILKGIGVASKNVIMDLSSLDHLIIMYVTKLLLKEVIPRTLFAAYIRPVRYSRESGDIGAALSDRVLAVEAVPGFAKRECDGQTLCAFLGFEGVRLKNVLEVVHNVKRFIPIVAFPQGAPQWYNATVWNSMDTLQSECSDAAVRKCSSESIFAAVELLRRCINPDEKAVLAPLGTRAHSMACAIFASQHPHARIIYDYVVESRHRAIGISDITIYHLSCFLNT